MTARGVRDAEEKVRDWIGMNLFNLTQIEKLTVSAKVR